MQSASAPVQPFSGSARLDRLIYGGGGRREGDGRRALVCSFPEDQGLSANWDSEPQPAAASPFRRAAPMMLGSSEVTRWKKGCQCQTPPRLLSKESASVAVGGGGDAGRGGSRLRETPFFFFLPLFCIRGTETSDLRKETEHFIEATSPLDQYCF